jgi:hypothetical protein
MGCCRLWGEGIWVYLGLCQDYWADNAMIYLGKYHIMKCFVWENQLENQVSSLQIVLYFLPRSLRFTFFFARAETVVSVLDHESCFPWETCLELMAFY